MPPGAARCTQAAPGDADGYPDTFAYTAATRTLHVGDGAFAPVAPAVYEFEVSGLKVVQSWLKYRMKPGAGRKSSPLDDVRPARWTSAFTTELLELLWVLEATAALYAEQERLLDAVVEGDCFQGDDLPPVPDDSAQTAAGAGRCAGFVQFERLIRVAPVESFLKEFLCRQLTSRRQTPPIALAIQHGVNSPAEIRLHGRRG